MKEPQRSDQGITVPSGKIDATRAQSLWDELELLGGIVDRGAIAELWGVKPKTVDLHAAKDGFPDPVAVSSSGSKWWLAQKVMQWRADQVRAASQSRGRGALWTELRNP